MRRLLLALGALAATACDRDVGRPNLEYMPDMVTSVAFDSFMRNPNTRDGRTLLLPPRGSIPRGFTPLHYGPGPAEAVRAGRELHNPMPNNALVAARGEVAFARWCSPCHGSGGEGDGLVARKFPRPPSLLAPHARGLPDGQIFHIVTQGQGLMPSYTQQVMPDDRWKLVWHVRRLQAAATAALPPPTKPAAPGPSPVKGAP
jgi:mono/diheme cytochrome c family protein